MTKFTIFFRVLWVFVIAFIIFVWNVSSIKNIDNSTNDVSSILYEKEKSIIYIGGLSNRNLSGLSKELPKLISLLDNDL